jgi:hypothetical protein
MHLTKRELRSLPMHALVDVVELLYVEWRFSGRHSALEGSAAVQFHRAAAELDRRRRRALVGRCTCEVCCRILEELQA